MANSMIEVIERIYKKEFETKAQPRKKFHKFRYFLTGVKKYLNEHSLVKSGILIICMLAVLWMVAMYNNFNQLKTQCEAQYAEIGNELKRRSNLYPHMVSLLGVYLDHETENFKYVSNAHESLTHDGSESIKESRGPILLGEALNSGSMKELPGILKSANVKALQGGIKSGIQNDLGQSLNSLMALVESYPDLKASLPVQELIKELITTENRIAGKKSRFNDSAEHYNQLSTAFPHNLICIIFGFPRTVAYISTNEEVLKITGSVNEKILKYSQ